MQPIYRRHANDKSKLPRRLSAQDHRDNRRPEARPTAGADGTNNRGMAGDESGAGQISGQRRRTCQSATAPSAGVRAVESHLQRAVPGIGRIGGSGKPRGGATDCRRTGEQAGRRAVARSVGGDRGMNGSVLAPTAHTPRYGADGGRWHRAAGWAATTRLRSSCGQGRASRGGAKGISYAGPCLPFTGRASFPRAWPKTFNFLP